MNTPNQNAVTAAGNAPRVMPFVYDDGGRVAAGFKGSAGDCVVRAVAIATGQPYQTIYDALSDGCRTERKCKRARRRRASARDGVVTSRKWFKDYMRSTGWRWTPTMHIGSGCTVHLSSGELPPGRLVVMVSRHCTAVIDGVIHDTYNPSERGTTIYSPNYLGNIPKGARWLGDCTGWAYSPARCVYGYWSKSK